jgi:Rrf2 family transcriptional regulator, cysteine metabolism repressor
MTISQKCHYALQALFELAQRAARTQLKIGQIAQSQDIPVRFLEAILNQLKQGGFVVSRRGNEGGYLLARAPNLITVGEIIRYVDGPVAPVDLEHLRTRRSEPRSFRALWRRAEDALSGVYDHTTIADLVEQERSEPEALTFAI